MSYVYANQIGCGDQQNPYDYLIQGPNTAFAYPSSLVTMSGKTGNTAPASTSHTMQGFFAEQVSNVGWLTEHQVFYQTLYSTNYPNAWLTQQFIRKSHTNINGVLADYNLGQVYLMNALAMSFITWSSEDFYREPMNHTEANSFTAPVFVNPYSLATGIKNMDMFIHSKNTKFDKLIKNVFQQAYASPDGHGPCGKIITYICNTLDRKMPGWSIPNETITQIWWNMVKNK
jgi:hypothetical protein